MKTRNAIFQTAVLVGIIFIIYSLWAEEPSFFGKLALSLFSGGIALKQWASSVLVWMGEPAPSEDTP